MAKFFVLLTETLSTAQEKKFHEKLTTEIGWWHWIPNSWLIKDTTSNPISTEQIRQYIQDIDDGIRCVVVEVTPRHWAARLKTDGIGKGGADWLDQFWNE